TPFGENSINRSNAAERLGNHKQNNSSDTNKNGKQLRTTFETAGKRNTNMTDHDSVEEMRRLLQVRLQEWCLREKNPEYRPKPVVTITREPGCGGESIAERLCAELGLHLYDWELVEQIAKDEDVSPQLVSKLEENMPTELEEWMDELLGDSKLSSQ